MDNPRDSKKAFFDRLDAVYEGKLDSDEDEDGRFKLPFKRRVLPPCVSLRATVSATRSATSRTNFSSPGSTGSLVGKVGRPSNVQPVRGLKRTGCTQGAPVLTQPASQGLVKDRPAKRAKTVASTPDVDRPVKGKERKRPQAAASKEGSELGSKEQLETDGPKASLASKAGPEAKPRLPDSLRFIIHDKVVGKRKPPAPVRRSGLFDGLYFYFVPNNLKGPARKFRIQRAGEHGAFCLNEWRADAVTHIVVDASYNWSQLLLAVDVEIPDNVVVVNEKFPGDCMRYRRILDHTQDMYQIPGRHPEPEPEPEPTKVASEPPASLQIKGGRRKAQETQRIHEATPPWDPREETPPRSSPHKRKSQDDSDSGGCSEDSD